MVHRRRTEFSWERRLLPNFKSKKQIMKREGKVKKNGSGEGRDIQRGTGRIVRNHCSKFRGN